MSHNVFVTGFPHCGTTILREVLGRSEGVHMIPGEQRELTIGDMTTHKDKKIIYKWPHALPDLIQKALGVGEVVMVLRNPWHALDSITRSYPNGLPADHSAARYAQVGQFFLKPPKGVHTIRYEDMFDPLNNEAGWSEELLNLMMRLRLKPPTAEFKGREHTEKPGGIEPVQQDWRYRDWQVTQPFENRNRPVQHFAAGGTLDRFLSNDPTVAELGYEQPEFYC